MKFPALAAGTLAFIVLVLAIACDNDGSSPTPADSPTPLPTTGVPTGTTTPTHQTTPTAAPEPTLTPIPTPQPSPPDGSLVGFTIYFIDVGQGDATLIVTDTGETLLVDGGRSKSRIRDRLSRLGVGDLDAILATHADADHIAGLVAVLEDYDIERIYWNGAPSDTQTFTNFMNLSQAEAATLSSTNRGEVIELGELDIQVLHPAGLTGDSNVDSIVLLVQCGTVEVILTGDAEVPSERSMTAAGILMDIDVLKVGHHGSRTATSPEFLDAVRPEYGVISAGLNSQYGHPHQETLDALTAAGVQVFRTDTTEEPDGVTLTTDCNDLTLAQP